VPVELSIFSLEGLGNLILHLYNRKSSDKGWAFRVLPSRVEGFNKDEHREALTELKEVSKYMLESIIRYNGKIPSAQRAGMDIYTFAPVSRGARDYRKLSKEIANLWQPKSLAS
jgi:cellulose biosynthesis protein BcsQ